MDKHQDILAKILKWKEVAGFAQDVVSWTSQETWNVWGVRRYGQRDSWLAGSGSVLSVIS